MPLFSFKIDIYKCCVICELTCRAIHVHIFPPCIASNKYNDTELTLNLSAHLMGRRTPIHSPISWDCGRCVDFHNSRPLHPDIRVMSSVSKRKFILVNQDNSFALNTFVRVSNFCMCHQSVIKHAAATEEWF